MTTKPSATTMKTACPLCGSPLARQERIREMMFGMRDEFTYGICSACGCSHLMDIPSDLSPFYPPQYLSFVAKVPAIQGSPLRQWLAGKRNQYAVFGQSFIGKALHRIKGDGHDLGNVKAIVAVLKKHAAMTSKNIQSMRVIDIGCGNGHLLANMALAGFKHLTGVEPYLPPNVTPPKGVTLTACHMADLPDNSADLIIMSHCLEHMDNQHKVFEDLRRILSPAGLAKIEIPIIDSAPYERYGVNWGECDAPRHLYLHTTASMAHMAQKHGLEMKHIARYTSPATLALSELYLRDIPWFDKQANQYIAYESHLSPQLMAELQNSARQDEKSNQGGRGIFWLHKPQ